MSVQEPVVVNGVERALCDRCWCFGVKADMFSFPDGITGTHIHRSLDLCVARLGERMGVESVPALQSLSEVK